MNFELLYLKIIKSIEAHINAGGKIVESWGLEFTNGDIIKTNCCCPLSSMLPNRFTPIDLSGSYQDIIARELGWDTLNVCDFVYGFDSIDSENKFFESEQSEFVKLGHKVKLYILDRGRQTR